MFLDDQWDPVKGPSEFVCGGKKPCSPLQDMGLSPAEVKEMTAAWSAQQAAVHRKIVAAGGFWALFNCKSAPTATQPCTQSAVSPWGEAAGYPGAHCPGCVANVSQQCTAFFRSACTPEAPIGKLALMLGLTRQAHRTLVNASGQLPALLQDLAAFMLIRGPCAPAALSRALPPSRPCQVPMTKRIVAGWAQVRVARARLDGQRQPLQKQLVAAVRGGLRPPADRLVHGRQREAGGIPAELDEG